jgi:thioredoxin-related protein
MDSIDQEILSNILPTLLISCAQNKTPVTYGELMDTFSAQFRKPENIALKAILQEVHKLKYIKALEENWNLAKPIFLKTAMSPNEVDSIHAFMIRNTNHNWTFFDLGTAYNENVKKNDLKKKYASEEARQHERDLGKARYAGYADPADIHTTTDIYTFDDMSKGLACAQKMNRPALVIFTGLACANSLKMESRVLNTSEVTRYLNEHFVVISLLVDDHTELKASDQYTSTNSKERVHTIGQKNSELQTTRFKSVYQPQFIVLDKSGKQLKEIGYCGDKDSFLDFLKTGLTLWEK